VRNPEVQALRCCVHVNLDLNPTPSLNLGQPPNSANAQHTRPPRRFDHRHPPPLRIQGSYGDLQKRHSHPSTAIPPQASSNHPGASRKLSPTILHGIPLPSIDASTAVLDTSCTTTASFSPPALLLPPAAQHVIVRLCCRLQCSSWRLRMRPAEEGGELEFGCLYVAVAPAG